MSCALTSSKYSIHLESSVQAVRAVRLDIDVLERKKALVNGHRHVQQLQ